MEKFEKNFKLFAGINLRKWINSIIILLRLIQKRHERTKYLIRPFLKTGTQTTSKIDLKCSKCDTLLEGARVAGRISGACPVSGSQSINSTSQCKTFFSFILAEN
jgi:hypothetical protein